VYALNFLALDFQTTFRNNDKTVKNNVIIMHGSREQLFLL